jgi:hypothetical protein
MSVIMLSVTMLSVTMLSVTMISVIMLSGIVRCDYDYILGVIVFGVIMSLRCVSFCLKLLC